MDLLKRTLINLVVVGAVAGPTVVAHAGEWQTETVRPQVFEVKPGSKLRIRAKDASMTIEGGEEATVAMEVEVRSNDMQWALGVLEKTSIRARTNGQGLVIEVGNPPTDRSRERRLAIRLRLRVPSKIDIDARTKDGEVAISKVQGRVNARSKDGSVIIKEVKGGVDANTKDGSISLEGVEGQVEAYTSDGPIRVNQARGSTIRLRTKDGHLMLTDVQASKRLSAETKDGNLQVRTIQSPVTRLETGDGNIAIQLPAGTPASVNLQGDRVRLGGRYIFEGDNLPKRVSGDVNDGGPKLKATTKDGSVSIKFVP